MNSIKFPARTAWRGHSGAVARTTARRRFAAGSVALAAVLASLAFTAGTAHASGGTGYCLDADSQQAYEGGTIWQWPCDSSDSYQQWTITTISYYGPAEPIVTLKDNGTGECLDLDAQKVYEEGTIWQWPCNSGDAYQQWVEFDGPNGTVQLENLGPQNAPECLDADAAQAYEGGTIWQWTCDFSLGDPDQLWALNPNSNGTFDVVNGE